MSISITCHRDYHMVSWDPTSGGADEPTPRLCPYCGLPLIGDSIPMSEELDSTTIAIH